MSPDRLVLASATMVSRRVSAIVTIVAIIAAFAMSPVELNAQTTGAPPSITNTNDAATMAYWTADRLATAKPMRLPRAVVGALRTEAGVPPASTISLPGHAPTLNVTSSDSLLFTPVPRESAESLAADSIVPDAYGTSFLRFTSSRLVTDAVAKLGGEKKYPSTIEGQLSFTVPPGTTVPPGNYVCSATVQQLGVITTAGHCVSDGNGHFFTNWVFVPATRNGKAPLGSWTWHEAVVTGTWHFGGGGVPNAQDVAVIELNKKGRKWIGNVTGWAGFNIPDLYPGQHLTVLGYPCNLDNCSIDHRTDAQASEAGNNTDVLGSDARGGASGGGWIINFGEYGAGQPDPNAFDSNLDSLVAVTSYGPVALTPLYLGASILDSRYVQCTPLSTCALMPTAVLNKACVDNPGACP